MLTASEIRDALAIFGAVVIVGLLSFIGGAFYGAHRADARIAAADSVALAKARADSARDATHVASLDSAIAAWNSVAARVDTVPGRVVHDTVPKMVPNDTTTAFIGMAQYPPGQDPATLLFELDSLKAAGRTVVRACTAVAQDCALVRAARDSLAVALATTRAQLATQAVPRLTANADLLYAPLDRQLAVRGGAALTIRGPWAITAQIERRLVRNDTTRLYVGVRRQWDW